MSGWMEKNIYIVSGLMGEREWTSASSSAISRLYFYYSHRTWVKWKLMARNDLVFWPLKYLIFEVCRWLSGADWNARVMAEGRWIRVTSAKRQEIDWRSHPSGNKNQKSQLVTWNYLKVSIIEHSPWPNRKMYLFEVASVEEETRTQSRKPINGSIIVFVVKHFLFRRCQGDRSEPGWLFNWMTLRRLLRRLARKTFHRFGNPKVSSQRRSWSTDLKNEISWVSITRKPAPKRIINRNQEIKLILLRIFALDSFVCWFCRRLDSRELFPRCQNAELGEKKSAEKWKRKRITNKHENPASHHKLFRLF